MKKTTSTTLEKDKKLKIKQEYPFKYKITSLKDLKKVWLNKGEIIVE